MGLPLSWRRSRRVFVNSMSDLFHEDLPISFISRVFMTMRKASQHQFQVLTKRAERMVEFAGRNEIPPNVWMGVSVENADYRWRVDHLRRVAARVRFLSIEPLIGPVGTLDLRGIHWVIVGGESGPRARAMDKDWVRHIHLQCRKARVPFFFKQWGGVQKSRNGRELDGRTWDEMPSIAHAP